MIKNKIHVKDEFEINGKVYFIPDRYIPDIEIGYEYQRLYKIILATVIDTNLNKVPVEAINKNIMDKYVFHTDKIFSYIITGKINNISFLQWEQSIINTIPVGIIPKLNPNIVECVS